MKTSSWNTFQLIISFIFGHFEQLFGILEEHIPAGLLKPLFTCREEHFYHKQFFRKKSTHLIVFGHWTNFFQVLAWHFDRVAKTALYVLEEPYEEKLVVLKKIFFMNFFRTVSKNYRPGCYCFNFPGKKYRNKQFFWKKMSFLDSYGTFYQFLAETFCQGGQNSIVGIERYFFLEKFCFWKKYIYFQARKLNIFL